MGRLIIWQKDTTPPIDIRSLPSVSLNTAYSKALLAFVVATLDHL
ncbi:MAG: hypothetical protein WBO36_07430 [Saprospiraceae bacterium]